MNASDIAALAEALRGGNVSAVQIKLPSFWTAKPELWFTQVEAQFSTKGVTAEKTKFDYVVQSLDNSTASEVEHFIMKPTADTAYTDIKAALIKAYGTSDDKKADELLNMGGLGDRKPTSLLRHMKSLNSDQETLFRCLFMSKLPHEVQTVLAGSGEKDVDKLAEMADKIVENTRMRHGSHLPQPPLGVSAAHKSAPYGKQGGTTTPSAGAQTGDSRLCFYHAKYGDKAHKCNRKTCPNHHKVSSAQTGGGDTLSSLNPEAENFQASRC